MTESDSGGPERLWGPLEAFDDLEVLDLVMGCVILDLFRAWGTAMVEALRASAMIVP